MSRGWKRRCLQGWLWQWQHPGHFWRVPGKQRHQRDRLQKVPDGPPGPQGNHANWPQLGGQTSGQRAGADRQLRPWHRSRWDVAHVIVRPSLKSKRTPLNSKGRMKPWSLPYKNQLFFSCSSMLVESVFWNISILHLWSGVMEVTVLCNSGAEMTVLGL